MSTARLTLKQPTGWFAAGREVAQALAVFSDGAFRLYIHLCLHADRHTARARIELTGLAHVLRKSAASIEADLGELTVLGYVNAAVIGSKSAIVSGPITNRLGSSPATPKPISCSRRGKLF
jgi:hypothetical protein